MRVDQSDLKKGNNVIVGIRFDDDSKELLSWAIVKVSNPGDRIIALHVCRNSDDISKQKLLLDIYLEVYKELCHMKMVGLTGKIVTGKSIRKTLVKEARNQAAVALLVGTTKQPTPLSLVGGWVSTAKYCAKHLPPTTQVLTVHNGKVVFTRTSTHKLHKGLEDPKPSLHVLTSENHSEFGYSEISDLTSTTITSPCISACSEQGSRNGGTSMRELLKSKEGLSFNNNNRMMQQAHSRSAISKAHIPPEHRPIGWPLLQKTSLPTQTALDARKMSVIQWVFSLPDRSSTDCTPPRSSITISTYASDSPSFNKSENTLGIRRREESTTSAADSVVFNGCNNRLSTWTEIPDDLGFPFESTLSDFTWFSYDVLRNSTSHFSSENLIGKGGCSQVYKGIFPDGKKVAVRVIKSSQEAWKDFTSEVDIISSLKHANITSLLGVCIENDKLISVYDFKSGGNLEQNLHGRAAGKPVLPWEARYKIAVGVAEALNYLHSGSSRPVIHRDVKSSNILLSDDFEPQLSDFGLAIWGPTSSSFETYNDVVGTFGYLAPEYFMYGKVSDKIDVYSFGVVLLELLSGRKPIGYGSYKGQESLVMWAKPVMESGKLRGLLDPHLERKFEGQVQRMAIAATLCLRTAARLRPDMSKVLRLLKDDEPIEKWIKSHTCEEESNGDQEVTDDEVYAYSSAHSYLNLVLHDIHADNCVSFSSMEQRSDLTLGEYFKGRWSRSSSFR